MSRVATEKAGESKAGDTEKQSSAAPASTDCESTVGPSSDCATVAPSSVSASPRSPRRFRGQAVVWEEVYLGHRIQPYQGYASCATDVYLTGCLLELTQLKEIDGPSVKLILRALRFLHRCDYATDDICSVLAHTSAYFLDAHALCGGDMASSEVGNVLVTLMFVAHSYVQDETCPLNIWHQHLFKHYCPLKTLSAAVVRLLEIRDYVLRLDDRDLAERYALLTRAAWKPHQHS